MTDNLTNNAEDRVMNWLTGNATTAPTAPLKLRLMTSLGGESTAGTQVTGGSYAAQTITLAAASGGTGATSNSADITFSGMPSCTVVGLEIWDSAGTPFRWWYGPLDTPRVLTAGDTLKFLTGEIDLSIG